MSTALVGEIAALLTANKSSLSVAESCTGGYLSASLTSISGASQWMRAGVTAYTEGCKRALLGLTDRELGQGLITEACAKGMVNGVARLTGSDYAIATTGVCDAVTEGFAPCTAWIGIKTPREVKAVMIQSEDRGRVPNMMYVVEVALEILLEEVRKGEI